MSGTYKLYGMPASLYMGKARSYLRKQQIPFVEYGANHPDFMAKIVPAVGRWIVPVLESPNGTIVQDGADIIDYFEATGGAQFSVYPESNVLRTVSLLFELFGGEGLLRPAMHYRWNFDEQNLAFVRNEFIAGLAPADASDTQGGQLFDMSSGRMRSAAVSFGVTRESQALIEASYLTFLTLFSAHLKNYPYLLGGRPTIGDFGLITALYAHLNRDPAATMLMRQEAPAVSRWTERMNASGDVWVEHVEDHSPINDNPVPDTLKHLLRYVGEEYLPEISAQVEFANAWLAAHPDLKAGTNGLDNPANRFIGEAEFAWRGITLKTAVLPYRFYLLQRVQDSFDKASASDQALIRELFDDTVLGTLFDLKTRRRIERVNHLEVWGDDYLDWKRSD
jgi:glutathione S-transferase